MRRLAVATGLVIVVWSAAAPAKEGAASSERAAVRHPMPALVGAWRVEGHDSQLGAYSGSLTFAADEASERLRYRREVQPADPQLAAVVERGTAKVVGGRVYLREDRAPPQGVLQRVTRDPFRGFATGERIAIGTPQAGGEVVCRFSVTGTLVYGRERLTRVTPAATGGDNRVDLLIDGPEAFGAIYAEVARARSSICLQTFSWFEDDAGYRMAALLREKARQGVTVRCLVEAFPQKGGIGWGIGPYLEEGGVEVELHHTFTEGLKHSTGGLFRKLWNGIKGLFGARVDRRPREKRGLLNHDHRKLIVVDGRVAFTGGMNIGDKYEQATTWHDIHARVEGSAVPELEAMFYDRWRAAGQEGEALPPVPGAERPGDLEVEVLENLPGLRYEITERYLDEIEGAQREILIENPYLLYDPAVDAMTERAHAGVRTVVIVPDNDQNDEALARDAFYVIQNEVVRAGVELYKYRDRMCHGKVAVFDRRSATVGTTNLDMMAMRHNAEVNLWIEDRGFAERMKRRVFDVDVPASRRIEVVRLSFWNRIKGAVIYSLRFFL